MSNSTIILLTFASQQVATYVGFFLFVGGIIGNPLTLFVFLSLRTFRESSCAFYLTVMSIVNICHLFTGLLTFIMINGFGIDWLNTSIFYCKFRQFYLQFCVMTSFSCVCLATIDQFLATCSHPRWHKWNNIKLASYIIIGITILWILHGIPFILYYDHTLSPVPGGINCVITNAIFQKYYTYFYSLALTNTIPTAIMILFGILAYRNVQQIAYRTVPLVRRELDKQLTVMVLVQVSFDIIAAPCAIVLSIFRTIFNAPNDPVVSARLNLITTTITLVYYFHFVDSFYIYVCVSKRFRQQLIHALFTIHRDRLRLRPINNNQIEPQT